MAAATPATSNGKQRGRSGWNNITKSALLAGNSGSGPTAGPRLTKQQIQQAQQHKRKEEEERRKALETALQSTKDNLEETTVDYENEKCKTEEMAGTLELLNEELATISAQLARANRSHEILREENRKKSLVEAALRKDIRRLEDRKTVLEYRCMDVEKLEIAVENGKRAFEAKQQQLVASEQELHALARSAEKTEKAIAEADTTIASQTALVDDLKLQVREELVKNVSLEEKAAKIPLLEERLHERETEASMLTKMAEDKDILYCNTKRALHEEKEANQKLSEQVAYAMHMKEEYNMATAENVTLKKLVQAKDVILIQKSQILANVRNIVSGGGRGNEVAELLQGALDSNGSFMPNFPLGYREHDVYSHSQLKEGDCGTKCNGEDAMHLPGSYEVCSDVKVNFRPTTSKHGLRLLDDASGELPNTHGRENQPEEISSDRSEHPLSDALCTQNRRQEGTAAKRTTSFFKTLLRQGNGRTVVNSWRTQSVSPSVSLNTCIVRPQLYTGSTFNDFRHAAVTSDNDDVIAVDLKSDPSVAASAPPSGIASKRGNCFRVKGPSRRANKISVFATSSPRDVTTTTPNNSWDGSGTPRCFVRTSSFLSPELLSPKRDQEIANIVRVGCRVIVDLSKRREKLRNRQSGVVQYIGTLDKQHDAFCLYAGIRFDKPIGDTDGMYRGKHYFSTCSKHGRFVRITKVVSVLDQANVYRNVDDMVQGGGKDDNKHSV